MHDLCFQETDTKHRVYMQGRNLYRSYEKNKEKVWLMAKDY